MCFAAACFDSILIVHAEDIVAIRQLLQSCGELRAGLRCDCIIIYSNVCCEYLANLHTYIYIGAASLLAASQNCTLIALNAGASASHAIVSTPVC